ncbi:MAG TPA: AMP-binding protein [Solirubrobacteraceae bacterium]|nr:AMP-binding protein [Solirubrobacteraceae bacterium]
MSLPLFPALAGADGEAVRIGGAPQGGVGDVVLTWDGLREAAGRYAAEVSAGDRVAVWAVPSPETVAGIVGVLCAGGTVLPLNARLGERERRHVLADAAPRALIAPAGAELPADVAALARLEGTSDAAALADDAPADAPAFVIYTSGTTGPPKGAVLPRRSVAADLDGLFAAWEWTADDVLVHGLPIFHVHGLCLGLIGPLRLGGRLRHLGAFSTAGAAAALADDATLMFGVPTMYHRLALDAAADPTVAAALRRARLLVSGSAALPVPDHRAIERLTDQRIAERYGMTETLITAAVRASGDRRPGYVGPPVDGVALRLVADDGQVIEADDDETLGEIQVGGPTLFLEYLNRPEATAEVLGEDGWFRTGDLATRSPDGYVRVVGRRATDLIKSGGYKIGAGEIEFALLEHPRVAEVAVVGEPDDDLGERIVAWVVPAGDAPPERELVELVATQLAPHKRPRAVRFVAELPRNEMGKVRKAELRGSG